MTWIFASSFEDPMGTELDDLKRAMTRGNPRGVMVDTPRGLSGEKVTRMLKQVGYTVAVGDADVCCTHFGEATAWSRKIYLAFPKQEMPDEKILGHRPARHTSKRSGWSGHKHRSRSQKKSLSEG